MKARGNRRWMLLALLGVCASAFALTVIAPAISNARDERRDRDTINEIALIYRGDLKLETMAKQIEVRIAQLRSVSYRHEENLKLARIYTEIGESLYHRNAFADAELAYRKANQLDGADARAMADLGQLFSAVAAAEPNVDNRIASYGESVRWYNQAADASSSDGSLVRGYEEHAAEVYLAEGHALAQASRFAEAGTAINEGLTLVPTGSVLARKLGDLRAQVTGVDNTHLPKPETPAVLQKNTAGH